MATLSSYFPSSENNALFACSATLAAVNEPRAAELYT